MSKIQCKPRVCENCYQDSVNEDKQNFYYRDSVGSKWYAGTRPVCDNCISQGEYREEHGAKILVIKTVKAKNWNERPY